MKLVKPILKAGVETLIDFNTERNLRNNHQVIFDKVGQLLEKAKAKGKYIDCKKLYKTLSAKRKSKIKRNSDVLKKFIDFF